VSSLGSRLSFRLTVLSEGGGVNSEQDGVSSVGGGVSSMGGRASRKGSWVPLEVRGGFGSWMGVIAGGVGVLSTGFALRGVELEIRQSVSNSEDFSTKRHCMMLMSLPPVEIRWLSLNRKLTLVT